MRIHESSIKKHPRRFATVEGCPWYARSRKITTVAAARSARDTVAMINGATDRSRAVTDEQTLFTAMHVAAYRAAKAKAGSVTRSRWLERWRIVRDHIVEANLGLAYSMFSRFNSPQVDADEMVSEAMLGLYRAVERFNPFKGYRFSTYACNCIARACMRERKRARRRQEKIPTSFDIPWNLTAEEAESEVPFRVERLRRALADNAADLNEIERRILHERFPTGGDPALTFKQIAGIVGLSKERVRQIQNIALDKLRGALEKDPLLC